MTEILFQNARVLDPRAGDLLPPRQVQIRDGRVHAIDTALSPGEGARVVDLAGRTLMPGLCDGHVHVTAGTADFAALRHWSPGYTAIRAKEIMEGMLQRGFTTVRDAGGADWGLAKAVAEDRIAGPRLLFCGHALSQTGGHGDMRAPGEQVFEQCFCCAGLGLICDGVDEVRRACREEIRRGATHIKLMVSGGVSSPTDRITSTQFAEEELRAAVQEAEAAMIPVMAHAYSARAINRAIRCGVTSIEHGNLLDESSIELFLSHDAVLVPTLSTYQAIAREGVEAGMPPALAAKVYEVLDAGIEALALAHRHGVKLVYGTDLLGDMHRDQLQEFAIRGQVQPPVEVIRAATCNAARLFRLHGEIGEVLPGARADLLVVEGNPLEDLKYLMDPARYLRAILKDGVFYKDELPGAA